MTWTRRALAASPAEARRRLAGLEGAFWLRDETREFGGAFPDASSSAVDPEPQLQMDPDAPAVPRWVGLLPYEAFRFWERGRSGETRPAPMVEEVVWKRYPAVLVCEAGDVRVEGESEEAVVQLFSALSRPSEEPGDEPGLRWAAQEEAPSIHEDRIRYALERIAAGDLYQVNLARRFEFAVSGSPIALLEALGDLAEAPFSAALSFGDLGVVSASPELFLELRPSGVVRTRPIKGTRPRDADPNADARLARELEESEKERAELAMVIDIERNDLGRLARTGSVRMIVAPRVVSHPTVHHREAVVEAQLKKGVSRKELLLATMPSGSVTGAPKTRAMELIAEREAHRRGLYTGALGYIDHAGGLRLSMAIRVLTLRAGVGHYFAGGGIVADSQPAAEVAETLWKAEQLSRLLGPVSRR